MTRWPQPVQSGGCDWVLAPQPAPMVPAPFRAGLFTAAILLSAGCEASRPPLSRAQAISSADSLLLREHEVWGNAIEVQPASTVAVDGQWWQVRYPDAPNGKIRLILVDEDTRWARFAPPEYVARVTALHAPRTAAPVRADPGPWILLVQGAASYSAEKRTQAEIDVNTLNTLAQRTGLLPLFSVRAGNDATATIIWGWQGEHGTVRDEKVREWLAARTQYQASRWVDLTE